MNEELTEAQKYIASTLDESIEAKRDFVYSNWDTLEETAKLLAICIKFGGKILICGNGGSAADAQHMAAELVGRLMIERKALPAIALTTDSSNLTAIGNDYGYEEVFSRQVEALGKYGDILIAISTSGNSPNVLKAVEVADKKHMTVISLTGNTGGKLKEMSKEKKDINLNVYLGTNSCRIQETHIFAIHTIVDLLDRFFL